MQDRPMKNNQITGPNNLPNIEVVSNDFPDLLSFWLEIYFRYEVTTSERSQKEQRRDFDSASASMDERKKSVKLLMKGMKFDRKKEYFLVLRDQEDDIEYERIPVHIDLAFAKDF